MTEPIPPGMRAEFDRILADGVSSLLELAAEYDGMDIIEANVELTNDLYARELPLHMLVAATAALALRLHRSGGRRA